MKKIVLLTSFLLVGLLLLTGCHNKVTNNTDDTSTPVATHLDTELASTADTMYSVTKTGAGVGAVSFVRGRYVGSAMGDLGTADADGYYTVTNTGVTGMVCKVRFKKGSDAVYFNMENILGTGLTDPQLYIDQDLTAAKIALSTVPQGPGATLVGWPRYVPSMFCKVADNKPLSWFTIASALDLQGMETTFNTWLSSNFPDSMDNVVTGTTSAGVISLHLTSAMTDKPTDANPATMTGTGSIVLSTAEVLSITVNVTVGASGPVGGTQTFTSVSGLTGTMTFHADKTMTGSISQSGSALATVSVAADGTGTLHNVSSGVDSPI